MDDGRPASSMASRGNFPSLDDISARRFLGLLKQPVSEYTPLELQESDVVWSFVSSDDSRPVSNSASPSPSSNRHRGNLLLGSLQSGLSAAFNDDHACLTRSLSRKVPASARQENAPLTFNHSVPVNIPLWPTKLRDNFGDINLKILDEAEDDDVGEEGEKMVPPHVIVARSHATFSVFEGVGRTLKGRDLRRVRNAVFQKTGFID